MSVRTISVYKPRKAKDQMNVEKLLSELKAERERLNQAIVALEGTQSKRTYTKRAVAVTAPSPRAVKTKESGGITPAGRKRLSEMMKKRWAERRKKRGA